MMESVSVSASSSFCPVVDRAGFAAGELMSISGNLFCPLVQCRLKQVSTIAANGSVGPCIVLVKGCACRSNTRSSMIVDSDAPQCHVKRGR